MLDEGKLLTYAQLIGLMGTAIAVAWGIHQRRMLNREAGRNKAVADAKAVESAEVERIRAEAEKQMTALRLSEDGWRRLCDQQSAELARFRAELTELRAKYEKVQGEYTEAVRLNMILQGDIDVLKRRVAALEKDRDD
jgi:chromosome segregation ATPase